MIEYDNKINNYLNDGRYIDAYTYIFKQKNIAYELDKSLYFHIILYQILVEVYLNILDDAKEHLLNIYRDIVINNENLVLFIKCILLLDMFDESLENNYLYKQLLNYQEDNDWINLYIILLSIKNNRRNFNIKDELIYIVKGNNDRFLKSLVHSILSEILKYEGDDKWLYELKIANELNPNNLHLIRFKIFCGILKKEDLILGRYYRYFPEKKEIISLYHDIYKKLITNQSEDFKFSLIEGGEIGGSSYLIMYQGINILLDAGANLKDGKIYLNDYNKMPIDIKDIDLLIITHCHLDHCGGIMSLINDGLNCPIILSKETELLLEGIFSNNYNKYDIDFTKDEKNSVSIIRNLSFTNSLFEKEIKGKKIKVSMVPAGHIIGARSTYIDINGFSIFYTGDFTLKDVETNKGLNIPYNVHADVLITEATFGYGSNYGVYNKKIQDKLLINIIKELTDNGIVFIPSNAIGKAQDLLVTLRKNYNYTPYIVYTDGALSYMTTLYELMIGAIYGNGILNAKDMILYNNKREFIKNAISLGNCLVMTSSDNLKDGSTSSIYGREMTNFNNAVLLNISNNNKKTLSMRQVNVPILNHGIIQDILEICLKLTPSKVYIVHRGAKLNKYFNIEEILYELKDVSVYTP